MLCGGMGNIPSDGKMKAQFLPRQETITVFTAARMIGVSMQTIRRWSEEGRIPAFKIVGRWYIDRKGFLEFLERCRDAYRMDV